MKLFTNLRFALFCFLQILIFASLSAHDPFAKDLTFVFEPPDSSYTPPDSSNTPIDSLFIPEDSSFIPSDSSYVPPDSSIIPSDSSYVPPDSTIVPSDSSYVPPDSTIVPSDTLPSQSHIRHPNILFILLDDARFDSFAPNGGPEFFHTPAINKIAEEGVNFKITCATTSLCCPSRASIYTGLYPHHHGAVDNETSPKGGLTYVSSLLKNAGYQTGFVGKWLLNSSLPDEPVGFDFWATSDNEGHVGPTVKFNDQTEMTYSGHDAMVYTGLGIDFLNNKVSSENPWALFLCHRVPHTPLDPIPGEEHLYDHAALNFPDNFSPYEKEFPSYLYPGHQIKTDSSSLDQFIRDYYESCHAAEESIDSILGYLESKNLLDSTMIIFMSDNGYMFGEHDLGQKELSYDESLRLPLFIRYPKWFAPGTVVNNEIASNVDIAPTLLELAGIPDTFHMDGVSLHQLAEGNVHRKEFFYEYYPKGDVSWEAIRTLDYAYVYSYCTSITEEFYDLTLDPKENNNLISDTAYASIIEEFRHKRDSLRSATNDTIFPEASNCSLQSMFYADLDHDGYGSASSGTQKSTQPAGYVTNHLDCNDNPAKNGANIHPGAPELCNAVDDNCNGTIDDGLSLHTYYFDSDHDGYGNPNTSKNTCIQPTGYITNNLDCNDQNAGLHPGTNDLCNGIDDNCNGQVDENAIIAGIQEGNSVNVCSGESVILTASGGTGITYQWLKGTKNIAGATDQTYLAKAAADYKVKETNAFNCSSTSAPSTLTIITTPTAAVTPLSDLNICTSGSVVLQVSGGDGFTYQWKKGQNDIAGATSANYTATVAATYKVVVNNNGCDKTSAAIKVTKTCREDLYEEENTAGELLLYPNPARDHFTVRIPRGSENERIEIEIWDMIGQLIYSESLMSTGDVFDKKISSDPALLNGIYLVKVTRNNRIYTGQLVMQQ